MAEFNKIYVNCVEDESLYGKYGFFSDSIDDLKQHVRNNSLKFYGKLSCDKSINGDFPFVRHDNLHWRYFYYDPKLCNFFCTESGRIVTHRELSRWLAQGYGEGIYNNFSKAPHLTFTELRYMPDDGNQPVQDILVRKWGDDEWELPTSKYLGLENQKS